MKNIFLINETFKNIYILLNSLQKRKYFGKLIKNKEIIAISQSSLDFYGKIHKFYWHFLFTASMPIIKSAIKRVRQEKQRRQRNLITKTKYKTLIKEFKKFIEKHNTEEAKKILPKLQKEMDLAAKKFVVHKNNAARHISRLSALLKNTKPLEPGSEIPKKKKETKKQIHGEKKMEIETKVKKEKKTTPKKK